MISLKPIPETSHECPRCRLQLAPDGWLITGMRNLADLRCGRCGDEFYGDLPAGQALYTPILLNKSTGAVYDDYHVGWFAEWLGESYARRTNEPLRFEIKKFSKIEKKVVLLNCLDTLYGHSLLKLLNAQYYTNRSDVSLIVLAPPFLEWLLPDGAAEAWIVDLPLRRGTQWNDWLPREIEKRLEPFTEVFLSVGFSHPHPDDFEIERFTRVKPFSLENWAESAGKPCVTFIWRDDRLWESSPSDEYQNRFGKIKRRFVKRNNGTNGQLQKVIRFAEALRAEIPALDFAVAGIGEAGGLPDWISDLRLLNLDAAAERAWCERYAQSHIVVGVHGSNMLLPSAHAGAVVEIIGEDRWGNFTQDILFRPSGFREMFFRYRFVPHSTAPEELARLAISMLRYEDFRRLMSPEFCRHRENYDFRQFQSPRGGRIDEETRG
jgi:ribosomal protein L33